MKHNDSDISNSFLGKFISLEFLFMIIMTGVSWGALTQRVSGLESNILESKGVTEENISELKQEAKTNRQEVAQINRKLDVMSNNQEHFKEQIETIDRRLQEILKSLEHRR